MASSQRGSALTGAACVSVLSARKCQLPLLVSQREALASSGRTRRFVRSLCCCRADASGIRGPIITAADDGEAVDAAPLLDFHG